MAEYISRNKALKVIDALDDISDAWGCAIPMHTIKEKIKEIPAADVRPVVLCRDCKYSYFDVSGLFCSYGICVDCIVREDFYCADGERGE